MPDVAIQETLAGLFTSFRERSANVFVTSLSTAHARNPDGMNSGDIGAHFRLATILELPGLLLDDGPIVAEPGHPSTPKNTTRLLIPYRGGMAPALVYCVRRKDEHDFVLTRRPVGGLATFRASARLLDAETPIVQHLVVGISYTRRSNEGSRRFTVWLLGGTIDFDRRILHAEYVDEIVTFPTSGGSSTAVQPVGPQPTLSPSRRGDGR